MADKASVQTGLKQSVMDSNVTKYALFLGGTNVTHDVLAQYDPLKTGFGRIFMVRQPEWVKKQHPNAMKIFKHILEYGNTEISSPQDISVDTQPIQGGYVGKEFDIPVSAKDSTNELSITVYDFSGSPIRSLLYSWVNGSTDILTGFTHYDGSDIPKTQANQTAEFIYLDTDATGKEIEYACLYANCFPKQVNNDYWGYTSGTHELVRTQIQFTAVHYESIQINMIAKQLLERYKILANSMNFFSGYEYSGGLDAVGMSGTSYNQKNNTIHYYADEKERSKGGDQPDLEPRDLDYWK